MKKRLLALILALAMVMQVGGGTLLSLAEEEESTAAKLTVTDADGNVIYEGTYDQESVWTRWITDGVDADEDTREAIRKATNYSLEDLPDTFYVNVSTNSADVPVTLKVTGNVTYLNVTDSPSVTIVGDVSNENGSGVYVGNVTNWDYDTNTIKSIDVTDATVVIDGDVNVAYTGVSADGNANITVDGNITSKESDGIIASNSTQWDYDANRNVVLSENNATIVVEGNVSAGGAGISAQGNADITVEGNITAGENGTYDNGINAEGNSTIEVTGDIQSIGPGISTADSATVIVTGNVESTDSTGVSAGNHWVDNETVVANNSTVVVDGDVTAYYNGVNAAGEADITVTGNIKSENDNGITASDKAQVTVDGTVTSENGSGIITSGDAVVVANDDITSSGYTGVGAGDSSIITVNGNVNADGSYGVYTNDEAVITVTGDVTNSNGAGIQAIEGSIWDSDTQTYVHVENDSTVVVDGSVTSYGDAIQASGTADISVAGDVTSTNGDGIWVTNSSTYDSETESYVTTENNAVVVVDGDVSSYGTGIYATGEAEINVAGNVTSDSGTAVNASGDAQVAVDGSATSTNGQAVYAYNNAVVVIEDDVTSNYDAVRAFGSADITINGDVTSTSDEGIWVYNGSEYDSETETWNEITNDVTVTVGGNVTSYNSGVSARGDAEITVAGNVASENGAAVSASENVQISVDGAVSSTNGSGISVSNSSKYDSEKDTWVNVDSNASINVGGDVSSYGTAVQATGTTDVTVTGNVTSTSGDGVVANGTTEVNVGKTVSAYGTAVDADDATKVTVGGSVTSTNGSGVLAYNNNEYDYETGSYTEKENSSVVVVNGDVTAAYTGVGVDGTANVTVKGDVTTGSEDYYYSNGVDAHGDGTVTITGNLDTTGTGVRTYEDTTVTVGGDVNAGGYGVDAGNNWYDGEYVSNNSTVTVGGNLTSGSTAIYASGKADITINGSATSTDGDGISARGDTTILVDGALTSDGTAIRTENDYSYDSERVENEDGSYSYVYAEQNDANTVEITVNGDVTSKNGSGISASGEANVSVDGSVNSTDSAIYASGNSVVDVSKDVTSTNGNGVNASSETGKYTRTENYDADGNYLSTEYDYEDGDSRDKPIVTVGGNVTAYGDGVSASGNANVTITGNVKAGHEYEGTQYNWDEESQGYVETPHTYYSGDGVYINGNANVTVGGKVESEGNGIIAYNDSKVEITGDVAGNHGTGVQAGSNSSGIAAEDYGKANVTVGGSVTAGGTGIDANEKSTVVVNGNVTSGNTAVEADGDAVVTIKGSAVSKEGEGVNAEDNSKVTVNGTLTSGNTAIDTRGNAVVTIGGNATSTDGNGIQATDTWEWDYENDESRYVDNNSTIVVDGDLKAYNNGIYASGDADITINGSLTAGHEYNQTAWDPETGTYEETDVKWGTGDGINVQDNVTVLVDGDLAAQGNAIYTQNDWSSDYKRVENEDGSYASVRTETNEANTVEITINGDVTSNYGDGIFANGEAVVKVDGSVDSYNTGVTANGDANVTVTGSVSSENGYGVFIGSEIGKATSTYYYDAEGNYISNEYFSEDIRSEASVNISGDVTSHDDGVNANGISTVEIGGNVIAGYESESTRRVYDEETDTYIDVPYTYYSGNGVSASGYATVTVGGKIESEATGVSARDNAEVTVGKDVTSKHGIGVDVGYNGRDEEEYGEASVTVNGSVTAWGDGINADEATTVVVNGDVTAGHTQEEEYTTSSGKTRTWTSYTGDGIDAGGQSTVTVDGDVTGAANGIVAYSDYYYDSEYEYDEEGNYTRTTVNGDTWNESTVIVTGDVTAEEWNGVNATGKSTVAVGGDVNGGESGAYAIHATGSAGVTVEGDVNGTSGIYTGNELISETTRVYERKADETETTLVSEETEIKDELDEAFVLVNGDVTAKTWEAINMSGNSNVTVWGDVTGGDFEPEETETEEDDDETEEEEEYEPTAQEKARDAAVEKALENIDLSGEYTNAAVEIRGIEGAEGQLIVGGTITAQGESVPVVINIVVDDADAKKELPDIPDIKVYEIAPNNDTYFDVNVIFQTEVEYSWTDEETEEEKTATTVADGMLGNVTEEEHEKMVEAIAAAIQYIIKVINPENGAISLSGTEYDETNDLQLAHEGDEIAVKVSANEGYEITGVDAGDIAQLIDNGDGTWTVIVKRGGGVTISATITQREVPAPAPVEDNTNYSNTTRTNTAATVVTDDELTAEDIAIQEELTNAVSTLLTKDGVTVEAEVTVQTAEDGTKTVEIAPAAEVTEEGNVVLQVTAADEMLKTLSKNNVTNLVVKNSDKTAEVNLDMEDVVNAVESKAGSELVVICEDAPVLNENTQSIVNEKYQILGAGTLVVKVLLREVDGTETELKSAKFYLTLVTSYLEGMKVLYIDENDTVTDTGATWAEATGSVPAHWNVPYMGNGIYLPAIEK